MSWYSGSQLNPRVAGAVQPEAAHEFDRVGVHGRRREHRGLGVTGRPGGALQDSDGVAVDVAGDEVGGVGSDTELGDPRDPEVTIDLREQVELGAASQDCADADRDEPRVGGLRPPVLVGSTDGSGQNAHRHSDEPRTLDRGDQVDGGIADESDSERLVQLTVGE